MLAESEFLAHRWFVVELLPKSLEYSAKELRS
jgi:hypothetical protein